MHAPHDTPRDRAVPRGGGERLDILGEELTIKGRAADGAWLLLEVKKNPESKAPAHSHPWDEIYYMLCGGMSIMVDGRRYEATPGTSIHVPAGAVHQFLGPVQPNTRFLALLSPAAGEAFFREIAREIPAGAVDPGKIAAIAARHGVAIQAAAAV